MHKQNLAMVSSRRALAVAILSLTMGFSFSARAQQITTEVGAAALASTPADEPFAFADFSSLTGNPRKQIFSYRYATLHG